MQVGDVVLYKLNGRVCPLLVHSHFLDKQGNRRVSGVAFDLTPSDTPPLVVQAVQSAQEGDGGGQWREKKSEAEKVPALMGDSSMTSGSTVTPSGSSTEEVKSAGASPKSRKASGI